MMLRQSLFLHVLAFSAFTLVLALPSVAQNIPSCDNKMWLPPGSVATTHSDGSVQIDAPDRFAYIGYEQSGLVAMFAEDATCSCTCEKGGGTCSPSVFNGNCSCTAKDGCTNCSLSTTSSVSTAAYERGGYVDADAGVSFAAATDVSLPAAFPAMFDLPEVRDAIQRFVDDLYQGAAVPDLEDNGHYASAPPGHTLAAVNAFGRVLLMIVPEQAAAVAGAMSSGSGTCSCTDGTCTYDSYTVPFKGTLHFCEGSCSGTCTLTLGIAQGDNFLAEHAFKSYTH